MLRLIICLVLFSASLGAQEKVIKDFIKVHRKGEENVAVKVPGWMVSLASDIATVSTDDPQERIVFKLMGEVGTTRVVTWLNEDFTEPQDEVVNLLYVLERYKRFERWAEVRSAEGERVTLSVRYENKKIRDLVAVVTEDDRTTLVSARTDLSADELGRLVEELSSM
ncbi:DUF4252 domain-containing protein [Lewinella sp. IMCC34183]|uniref:DUF4252 domain-containing protein n=1 Tax=Lewinella sp. IMCC34183 TaxID=2248762 RepID=UPI000E27CE83|nr:DUF4252 domain-containing protein [Lewinella sp. IMCC34183]